MRRMPPVPGGAKAICNPSRTNPRRAFRGIVSNNIHIENKMTQET